MSINKLRYKKKELDNETLHEEAKYTARLSNEEIYLSKHAPVPISNRDTRKGREICSKLTIQTVNEETVLKKWLWCLYD